MTYRVKSAKALIEAYRLFQSLPDGETAMVNLPNWFLLTWGKSDFLAWFHDCLSAKINREDTRKWRNLSDEYCYNLRHDVRMIRDYAQGIRHTGSMGLLNLPEMRHRYPHVNCQPREWEY